MSRIEQFRKRAEAARDKPPDSALSAPELRTTLERFKLDRRLNQPTSDMYVGAFLNEVSGLNGEGAYAKAITLMGEASRFAQVGGRPFQYKATPPVENDSSGQIILDDNAHSILAEYVHQKLDKLRNGNRAGKPDTNGHPVR